MLTVAGNRVQKHVFKRVPVLLVKIPAERSRIVV
jgi:hypothetical protein